MMRKKLLLRALLGIPTGVLIGQLVTIFVSFGVGDGAYYPCAPALTEVMGNEVWAVTFQTLFCGLLGAVFAGASLIWETERWSLARQTVVYFLITAPLLMLTAYLCGWMPSGVLGFLYEFGIYAGTFAVIWLAQYLTLRAKLKRMNQKIQGD